ncbi:MAG TPA: hypothetical protein VJM33_08075 [Microthrixaceae bacterium]|nr:hypothetical protein [Microthrixaceae bacterium]
MSGTDVIWWSCSWAAFGIVSGWVASRWPLPRWSRDGWLTTIRDWEHYGDVYRRIGVRRWKDRLPEAGGLFAGGYSKRRIHDPTPATLTRFAAETRRAELVHWANAAWGWTFLLWAPLPIGVVMVCFGAVAHLPFVVVQRYNRGRIQRILDRRRITNRVAPPPRDPGRPGPPTPPDRRRARRAARARR